MKKVLEIKNLVKSYGRKDYQTKVLKNINLDIYENDFIAIMGSSGAGKSTLLNMLSTLDKPTYGQIMIDGEDITKVNNKRLSKIRQEKIGFIFQDYNLLDNMTLQDNIALPLSLNGKKSSKIIERTKQIASLFGLNEHLNKYPYQLSGGQKQRGASARALITNPQIIFADEPTGALDSKSSKDLLESLKYANEHGKATILMVTHDAYSASYAKQVYMLSDGEIKCRLNHSGNRQKFYDEILSLLSSMGSDQE
ncbi:ABC transporter ATP-binding protein [Thomasclavelia cocleata]|uniref:Putative ABC transport system ATP-binding protein n=1 Tax=Thomasclavelia cocleata TaxID=69824 RepID=A0A1I0FLZ9_9FIRM|nr:ABC transporter ATP-binding protein [Thomasclavelia cocleata]MCR1961082.1 ABC transporter ATP-binding protein [Thomasclavelia cocleata]NDO41226.1 ABC transporter ATP-binding protein [Thomasclavelia cocleata]PJN81337.1 ABC transporter ATP-binding protein [Thomasclavelia cocleata]SET59142.1 putative ABC transport system ATP-binding protein [Thomasclavelia cocleata]